MLWTIPSVVVEVGGVFTGLGAVVPSMPIIATNFAHEVQIHDLGIVFTMFLELGPFVEVLR